MSPEQFCYWLQGRLEMSNLPLSAAETDMIRAHLATVFVNVTREYKGVPFIPPSPTEFKPIEITCDGGGILSKPTDIPDWKSLPQCQGIDTGTIKPVFICEVLQKDTPSLLSQENLDKASLSLSC